MGSSTGPPPAAPRNSGLVNPAVPCVTPMDRLWSTLPTLSMLALRCSKPTNPTSSSCRPLFEVFRCLPLCCSLYPASLVRRKFNERMTFLKANEASAVKVSAAPDVVLWSNNHLYRSNPPFEARSSARHSRTDSTTSIHRQPRYGCCIAPF